MPGDFVYLDVRDTLIFFFFNRFFGRFYAGDHSVVFGDEQSNRELFL